MPSTAALEISVRDTLKLLDGPFEPFAAGVSNGTYAFWLGSGISLGRAPGLRYLVCKVVEFIRSHINQADVNCKFARAMQDVFVVGTVSDDEDARSDLSVPFESWPDQKAISQRLVNNYSKLLGITIDGEELDYLLWNVVDVRATFADVALMPDVEHLCLAALSLEGTTPELLSANWDSLIERAIAGLTDNNPALSPSVVARPVDLQLHRNKTRLIKFHGCAEKASEKPGDYRQWLVATHDQVVGWCTEVGNKGLVTALTHLVSTKPTLMLGLSAQDVNVQSIFNEAANQLMWQLGQSPPSYVFSENELGMDQRSLLKNVYRGQITTANLSSVLEAARIQAFAKPLLTALLLDVLSRKLQALILLVPSVLLAAERQALRDGVRTLRDSLANDALPTVEFVEALLDRLGRGSKLLRDGHIANEKVRYEPITGDSVSNLPSNAGLGALGLGEAAVALGLLGIGLSRNDWKIDAESTDVGSGVLAVTGKGAAARRTKVFLTANANGAAMLRSEGHLFDTDTPVLIQSKERALPMSRSPRRPSGRTGLPIAREVSISTLLNKYASADELYLAFRQELAL
jgi:hypothetical protein